MWDAPFGRPKCSRVKLPVPWDPVYLKLWSTFVRALAARYDRDPTVVGVKVCGINSDTMEQFLPSRNITDCTPVANPNAQWAALGYTPQKIVDTWDTLVAVYRAAFNQTTLVLMTGGHPFPGVDDQGRLTPDLDMNMTTRLLFRFIDTLGTEVGGLQSNGMSASWFWEFPPGLPPGTHVGCQALWAATGDPQCRMKKPHTPEPPCPPVPIMNQTLARAVRDNMSYFEVYTADILNPDLAEELEKYSRRFNPPL